VEADFVIVGAGSAGCALAARLSEDGRHRVVVLEHGGSDEGTLIQMPSALSYPMNMPLYDWGFSTEPEPGLGNRRLVTPRGKVIGGSSSINGMVFVRGHAGDFDTWEEMGATGWGYRHVLPYFKRLETSHHALDAAKNGETNSWRGTDGPIHVTRGRLKNPLYQAFVDAGDAAGYGVTSDYNGERQEGFGAMERTIWKGQRWSAANAYLKPALKQHKNLKLVHGLARRVIMEGRRAVGLEYQVGGRVQTIRATREVIIAASTINSPKLLMLSGIGDGAELQRHGIPVVADRPGVGGNLQDHLEVYFQMESLKPVTLNGQLGLISKGFIGLQWLLFRSGLGATNHFEACGFIRSDTGVPYPDIQYHFLPGAIRYDGTLATKGHGFQVHVGPMRAKSRGRVSLRSSDPKAPPLIRFNYMSHPDDWTDFRKSLRLTREIFAQSPMKPYRGREIQPGDDVTSDAALDAFIRDHAESAYHPCGTCRMGRADDPLAVVDPECRVIGVENLRVADSSIFPQVTNGNLNAPSLMTGEKAADHILGKTPLPAANVVPWTNPDWQTRQR
jgi:choline dehydrogenase